MVIRFDLGVLPLDLKVEKAFFEMYCHGVFPKVDVCSLFTIQSPWKVTEATWMNATSSVKWKKPGVDYNPSKSVLGRCVKPTEWERYDVTEMVKYFLQNPDKNYGFTCSLQDVHAENGRLYYSSDYKFIDHRPRLIIESDITNISEQVMPFTKDFKILIKSEDNAINLYIPFKPYYSGFITDARGRTIYSFSQPTAQWYTIPKRLLSQGVNLLTINTEKEKIIEKIISIK